MELVVRPFVAADESRLRELAVRLSEGFAPWRAPDKVTRTIAGWIDDAIDTASDEDRLLLVGEISDTVVGFISVTARDHYIDGRDAYIGELAVDQAYEGRGIAQTLVDTARIWAVEHGCDHLTLQTGAANERAIRFYEKLGFAHEDVALALPLR